MYVLSCSLTNPPTLSTLVPPSPELKRRIGTLERDGAVREFEEMLASDPHHLEAMAQVLKLTHDVHSSAMPCALIALVRPTHPYKTTPHAMAQSHEEYAEERWGMLLEEPSRLQLPEHPTCTMEHCLTPAPLLPLVPLLKHFPPHPTP